MPPSKCDHCAEPATYCIVEVDSRTGVRRTMRLCDRHASVANGDHPILWFHQQLQRMAIPPGVRMRPGFFCEFHTRARAREFRRSVARRSQYRVQTSLHKDGPGAWSVECMARGLAQGNLKRWIDCALLIASQSASKIAEWSFELDSQS